MEMTPQQVAQLQLFTTQNIGDITKAVTENISLNVGLLIEETKRGKEVSQNQGRIKDQCENIVRCDGQITEEIREWLKSADLAVRNTIDIPNNVQRITRKTTAGQLYRSIEGQFRDNTGLSWTRLKTYVSDAFLGTNEGERLRLELSKT